MAITAGVHSFHGTAGRAMERHVPVPEPWASGVVNAQSTLRSAGTPRARDTRDGLVLTGG